MIFETKCNSRHFGELQVSGTLVKFLFNHFSAEQYRVTYAALSAVLKPRPPLSLIGDICFWESLHWQMLKFVNDVNNKFMFMANGRTKNRQAEEAINKTTDGKVFQSAATGSPLRGI